MTPNIQAIAPKQSGREIAVRSQSNGWLIVLQLRKGDAVLQPVLMKYTTYEYDLYFIECLRQVMTTSQRLSSVF